MFLEKKIKHVLRNNSRTYILTIQLCKSLNEEEKLKKADGYVFTCAYNEPLSVDSLESYFKKIVQIRNQTVFPCILLVNKSDQTPSPTNERKIQQLLNDYAIPYCRKVSSKSIGSTVELLFLECCKRIEHFYAQQNKTSSTGNTNGVTEDVKKSKALQNLKDTGNKAKKMVSSIFESILKTDPNHSSNSTIQMPNSVIG